MRALHHLASILGIVGLLASFTASWWSAQLFQGVTVGLSGTEAQPLAWSLSLAAGAAYGASLLLHRVTRRVTLVVMATMALGALLVLINVSQPPADALASAVEAVTGIAGTGALGEIESVERSFAPIVALAASALAFTGAASGQFVARDFPGRDRYSSQPSSTAPGDSQGAWDSLSEGRDPTTSVE